MGQGYMNSYCGWLLLCKTKLFFVSYKYCDRSYGMLLPVLFLYVSFFRNEAVLLPFEELQDVDVLEYAMLRRTTMTHAKESIFDSIVICFVVTLLPSVHIRVIYSWNWIHFNIIQCAYVKHVIIPSRLPHIFGGGCIPGFKDYRCVNQSSPYLPYQIFEIFLYQHPSTRGIRLSTIRLVTSMVQPYASSLHP